MTTKWWENFTTGHSEDAELIEIINLANEIDEKEEDESEDDNLSLLSKMINEAKGSYDPEQIDTLKKKLKILENRRERRISEDFGKYIRSRREELGITLTELGEKTRISPSYINRLELAQRSSPSIVMVEKIAKGLSTPFADIAEASGIDLGLKNPLSGATSISHLIKNNNVSLRNMGPQMNEQEKEALIDIIDYISNASWGENSRNEALEVMDLIDRFKIVQKK